VSATEWRPTVGSVVRVWPHPPHPYRCTCRGKVCLNSKLGRVVQVNTWHRVHTYYVMSVDGRWGAPFRLEELQDVQG
jgi:hypothetical protein